jgi:hypothetical protein
MSSTFPRILGASIALLTLAACADGTAPLNKTAPSAVARSGGTSGGGGGGGGSVTTPTGVDAIKFKKNSYDAPSMELLVSAVSSNTSARLSLYSGDGTYIGEVQNGSGGQYGGNVFILVHDPVSITIRSSAGGVASIQTVPFQL